jgi:hypothetical protein
MATIALGAAALAVGLAGQASAAPAAPSPSQGGPSIMAPCDGNWYENGSFLTEKISPWYKTSGGVDFTREIRFKAVSGVNGIRGVPQGGPGCFWQTTKVAVAGYHETKSCRSASPTSCTYSGFVSYSSPFHGWRAPGQAQGWDPYQFIWRNYGFV